MARSPPSRMREVSPADSLCGFFAARLASVCLQSSSSSTRPWSTGDSCGVGGCRSSGSCPAPPFSIASRPHGSGTARSFSSRLGSSRRNPSSSASSLLERRLRKRAQSAVEDQAAYEHTIAQLTADVAHHAFEDAPVVLGDALARVATYAGASEATLVQYAEAAPEAPLRLSWMRGDDVANGNGSSSMAASTATRSDAPLAIPLVADGTVFGALELHRSDTDDRPSWPTTLTRRLDSAGEIIANEMSRARAARVIRRVEEINRAVLRSLLDADRDSRSPWHDHARQRGVARRRQERAGRRGG